MLDKEFPKYKLKNGLYLKEAASEEVPFDTAVFEAGSIVSVLAKVIGTDLVVIYSDDIQDSTVVRSRVLEGYEN